MSPEDKAAEYLKEEGNDTQALEIYRAYLAGHFEGKMEKETSGIILGVCLGMIAMLLIVVVLSKHHVLQ